MSNLDYQQRVDAAKRLAHGHWTQILASIGADQRLLGHRDLPCPRCGGDDRFRYDDKFGDGNTYCRHCGAGDGFALMQALTGWDFHAALLAVEKYLGSSPTIRTSPAQNSGTRMRQLAQRIWNEATPIAEGDDAYRYLRSRRLVLPSMSSALRFHAALGYFARDTQGPPRRVADYPALLARVEGADGQLITLQRTYLTDGRKAAVPNAKKLLSGGIDGAAVRLFEPGEELAVTEGIETALAVYLATGHPVWAALSAGNLEKLWIPPHVRRVLIYADNDAGGSFAGQAAAFALARRLTREPLPDGTYREIQVFVPPTAGEDWADVWRRRRRAKPATPAPSRLAPAARPASAARKPPARAVRADPCAV